MIQPLLREAVCLRDDALPADQGKYGDAERQKSHNNPRDRQAERRESIKKEKQDQTPGGY